MLSLLKGKTKDVSVTIDQCEFSEYLFILLQILSHATTLKHHSFLRNFSGKGVQDFSRSSVCEEKECKEQGNMV